MSHLKKTRGKLTKQQVEEIRNRYETKCLTQTGLALMYKVSPAMINHIVKNRCWEKKQP